MLMMQFETKAQDRWKFYNSLAVMYGQYDNALLMDKQNEISVHVSGDYLNQAGFRVGVQSTKINLNQVYGLSSADQQNQENYLLSIYLNQAFKDLPGYLTFKLDAHQAHNNSSNSFSHAQALAPEIEWLSNTQKFRINWSYANSRYVNLKPVHQVSTGFSYRMNNDKDIVSGRVYHIRNLEPNMTLGHDRLVSSEVRFTHLLSHRNPIIPNATQDSSKLITSAFRVRFFVFFSNLCASSGLMQIALRVVSEYDFPFISIKASVSLRQKII